MKIRTYISGTAFALVAFALISMPAPRVEAQAAAAPQAGASQQPAYTMPEYNAFQACKAEKDPNAVVKCGDDFTSKFPSSTLLQYVYALEYTAYAQLKNYPKDIEFADKVLALGDKADVQTKLGAIQARLQAFAQPGVFDAKAADANDQLTKDRDAALLGSKLLGQLQKPANVTDQQWSAQLDPAIAFFNAQAGAVDLQLKDYNGAAEAFKVVLQKKPDDATSSYQLGFAYLAMTPPQTMTGFWTIARAIDNNVPSADKVKDYLKSKVSAYEQPGCDSQVDAQISEMLTLAKTSPEPPATYTIPSADDLNKIRQSSNILTVISDLGAGGDKAKTTWLALCGAEFPEVVGKIIDIQTGDGVVDFKAYTGSSSEDMQAATTANMDVKVYTAAPASPPAGAQITPQPDVTRLQKDDGIQFAGTMVGYDPSPFLLHWDQVKVDPSTIPAKGATGRGKVPAPPKK